MSEGYEGIADRPLDEEADIRLGRRVAQGLVELIEREVDLVKDPSLHDRVRGYVAHRILQTIAASIGAASRSENHAGLSDTRSHFEQAFRAGLDEKVSLLEGTRWSEEQLDPVWGIQPFPLSKEAGESLRNLNTTGRMAYLLQEINRLVGDGLVQCCAVPDSHHHRRLMCALATTQVVSVGATLLGRMLGIYTDRIVRVHRDAIEKAFRCGLIEPASEKEVWKGGEQ